MQRDLWLQSLLLMHDLAKSLSFCLNHIGLEEQMGLKTGKFLWCFKTANSKGLFANKPQCFLLHPTGVILHLLYGSTEFLGIFENNHQFSVGRNVFSRAVFSITFILTIICFLCCENTASLIRQPAQLKIVWGYNYSYLIVEQSHNSCKRIPVCLHAEFKSCFLLFILFIFKGELRMSRVWSSRAQLSPLQNALGLGDSFG